MSLDSQRSLTERQEAILGFVVEEYVASGSPVGSKALVARSGMRVGASTVRYDLAQLEEFGYLTHPHTSAGRVPTEAGYRFFVEQLLTSIEQIPTELELDLSSMQSEIDVALQATTEALAGLTHLLALATAPAIETTVVRHVEVLQLQPNVVVVVTITATGDVSKHVAVLDVPVEPRLVEWAAEYLNESFRGRRLTQRLLRQCFDEHGLSPREHRFLDVLRPRFTELASASQSVFVGGAAGLLAELKGADLGAFRRLLEVLDERAEILTLVRQTLDSKRPFVRVGSELEDPDLATVALVGASYGLPNRNLGTVSLLGPTRMDYVKAVAAVRVAARELSRFMEELYD
jgi:heat-inducible transcriptional repressor